MNDIVDRIKSEGLEDQLHYLTEMSRKAIGAESVVMLPRLEHKGGTLTLMAVATREEMPNADHYAQTIAILIGSARNLMREVGSNLELRLYDGKGKEIDMTELDSDWAGFSELSP